MTVHDPLITLLIYLGAMVVSVPLAKKLGLGMVLGYLVAGVGLGPSGFALLGDQHEGILHVSEFGVIMMLFLIGLELQPSVLWKLRGPIFGSGGMQVVATSVVLGACGVLFGLSWQVSLAGAMILSLSSTAIVLQTLQESGSLKTTGGEVSFSVLLFQDMAVIPMLALIPFLAAEAGGRSEGSSILNGIKILGAVGFLVLCGRYLVRPIFRMVGAAKLRELFTAMALFLVLAITALMNLVGLSPALGAFLAGVVLADSEYRHQLETDIEPFKGLLLGAFFISVGAGIQFSEVLNAPAAVLGLVGAIVLVKWGVLVLIGKLGRLSTPDSLLFAFALAQGGEFAFVLLNFSHKLGVFSQTQVQQLTAAVALSMIFAPFLIQGYLKKIQPRFAGAPEKREADEIDKEEQENPVIIAGYGRFGQMVSRLLRACGYRATVLDYDVEQIEMIRKFGQKGFYGDASQMDLLKAAGAKNAKLLVVAIDDRDKALEIIEGVKKEFPHLKVLARAFDRIHAYEMIHLGIEKPYIETAGSALNLGIEALRSLGMPGKQAVHSAHIFNRHNDRSIQELAQVFKESDSTAYMSQAKSWLAALESTMKSDLSEAGGEADRSWESAPRT